MDEIADVVVVGLGAMGSAALWQLARRGVRAIGIDRYDPPHTLGSTHGESRITRLACGEGEAYLPLVARSHAIWREAEALTGESLMLATGGLILARPGVPMHGRDDFIGRTVALAEEHGIAHAALDAPAIAARFPQFALAGDETGYWERDAGVLSPERCVAAQLRLAREAGAVLRTGETVLSVRPGPGGNGVRVTTDRGAVSAGRAVLTAGAWVGGLAGGQLAALARPTRQILHWFAPEDPAAFAPGRFPWFIWLHGTTEDDNLYGFPSLDGATVKLAAERATTWTMPDTVARAVEDVEGRAMFDHHVAGRVRGIRPEAVRSASCLYTVTPDSDFVVDDLPGCEAALVVSACSGHGFKHSAAMGEAVAERVVLGESRIDLSAFSLGRFAA